MWEKKEAGRIVKVKVDVEAVWSGKLLVGEKCCVELCVGE